MLYFTLRDLAKVNIVYQFSLEFFNKIIDQILDQDEVLRGQKGLSYEQRVRRIFQQLYSQVLNKTLLCIFEKDKILIKLIFA